MAPSCTSPRKLTGSAESGQGNGPQVASRGSHVRLTQDETLHLMTAGRCNFADPAIGERSTGKSWLRRKRLQHSAAITCKQQLYMHLNCT